MRAFAQFNGSEGSPGLLQDFEDVRLPIILYVQYGAVVMTVGFHSGRCQFQTYGYPIFDSRFMKFVLRITEFIKLEILVEDSDTGGPSSITVS